MAELNKPHPPGDYPVVVVGSGPGGLQISHYLTSFGIRHALLSADDKPGGMFTRFPIFQRLITWTKLHPPVTREYPQHEWFDWNSLLTDDLEHRGLVADFMDGSSYFPARHEMESGIAEFERAAGIRCRYGCTWESTSRTDTGDLVLSTSDGDYRCKVAVIATGMADPWKPDTVPGIDAVPHYAEVQAPESYAGKSVFLIGKRNSGFELADGLLPWAKQIILASPRPAKISVLSHSTAAARARYLQPYEDHVLGGGNVVLDAAIERIEVSERGYTIRALGTTKPSELTFEVDSVIAATGFTSPLADLRRLGVATFYQDRLPSQTPFWESATAPGIYFAGAITQGSIGLKKYGKPSSSAAVHGFRYNARVLARHIAERHFGSPPRDEPLSRELTDHLLDRATKAPQLWNQQSYLTEVVELDEQRGPRDRGTWPLAHFVDSSGPDAVAITIETDPTGEIHPAVYIRRRGEVSEHTLDPDPLHDFGSARHRAQLAGMLPGWADRGGIHAAG